MFNQKFEITSLNQILEFILYIYTSKYKLKNLLVEHSFTDLGPEDGFSSLILV
jgi:hypothetical protein